MISRAFIAVLFGVASIAPALGATVSVTTGSFSYLTDVANQTINLQQFDPSLGTLQQVDFTLTGNLSSTLTVIPGSSPAGGGYTVSWSKAPAPPGFLSPGDPSNTWGFRFQIADGSSLGLTAGSQVVNSGNITPAASGLTGTNSFTYAINDSRAYSLTSNLSPFVGTGLFAFFANANTWDNITVSGAGSGSSTSMMTALTGDLTATYTYAPAQVPLPAALPLLASSLGVFGFMGRRRKQKAVAAA